MASAWLPKQQQIAGVSVSANAMKTAAILFGAKRVITYRIRLVAKDTPLGYNLSMDTAKRQSSLNRLKRIEGQVRGIARMIEEDRYCIDTLNQVQAVKAALKRVENEILKGHAANCVEEAIVSGDAGEQREKFDELVELFGRYNS